MQVEFAFQFRCVGALLLFMLLYGSLSAQNSPDAVENIIEQIAQQAEEDADLSAVFDDLIYLSQNPINLNETSREELQRLQFLDDIQINSLLYYINRYKPLATIYELQHVEGLTMRELELLLPFITVAPPSEDRETSWKSRLTYGKHTVFVRTQWLHENQRGYEPWTDEERLDESNSKYLGNKYKYYTRYYYQHKTGTKWGVTLEKDQGEEFFGQTQPQGFDFMSAHLQLDNLGPFNTLIVGDYLALFGQGLHLGSGMGGGKSAYVMQTKQKYSGIKKYSSVNENQFFRGVAATLGNHRWRFTPFVSYKNIDANIAALDTVDNQILEVSSFQLTGMHNTYSTVADKDAISEFIVGANAAYAGEALGLGLTFSHYNYSAPLYRAPRIYNGFSFSGNQNYNLSMDYQYLPIPEMLFYGETAYSMSGGMAFLNGMEAHLAPQVKMNVVHRFYEKDYQAIYSMAFGEASGTANEKGLYVGVEIFPYKDWRLALYFDTYSFPWMRSRTYAPVNGYDYLVQLEHRVSRHLNFYLKYKSERKPENLTMDDRQLAVPVEVHKQSLRAHLNYLPTSNLSFKSRMEWAFYGKEENPNEQGVAIYQDIKYKFLAIPLDLTFRYALFDAPYNARIYAYENDILYGYSIPAYFNQGSRIYLTGRWEIRNGIDLWFRWAQFYYHNVATMGSGITQIEGNQKNDFKLQMRFKF